MQRKKVYVAMSGGIDSSFAAYLLKRDGFDVCGITMNVFPGSVSADKAKKIAAKLKISHYTLNLRSEFYDKVIKRFCRAYQNGITPNPCIICNRYIKFGLLMREAVKEGAYFATGHYARVLYEDKSGNYLLKKGLDLKKDQSYVLYVLNQKQLSRILLPLGIFSKEKVFSLVQGFDIPVQINEESQDLCFIPDGDYPGFIRENYPKKTLSMGKIVDPRGKVLGTHKGLYYYTIGQKKGLNLPYPEPLFVLAMDKRRNLLIVGKEQELYARDFEIGNVLFTNPKFKKTDFFAAVKIRYHHQEENARVRKINRFRWRVTFAQAQKSITPGQSAVFYAGDTVLGGGIITKVARLI